MKIDKKTIKSTSELAHIDLTEKDIEKYLNEFNKILDYVEKLKQIKTESNELPYVRADSTPLRKDLKGSCLNREKAFSNHHHKKDNFFTVPKFIDQ